MINVLYSILYHVYVTYSRYVLTADTCVVPYNMAMPCPCMVCMASGWIQPTAYILYSTGIGRWHVSATHMAYCHNKCPLLFRLYITYGRYVLATDTCESVSRWDEQKTHAHAQAMATKWLNDGGITLLWNWNQLRTSRLWYFYEYCHWVLG